jgi:hypothetical protein
VGIDRDAVRSAGLSGFGRVCVVLVGVGFGVAWGQEAPLAGPRVDARDLPGAREAYAPGASGMAMGERPAPLAVFFQSLRELHGPEAPEGVRLTPEQVESIRHDVAMFRELVGAFIESHGDEIRALMHRLTQNERGRLAGELRGLDQFRLALERAERIGVVGRLPDAPRPPRADRPAGEEAKGFRLRIGPGAGEGPADPEPMPGMTVPETLEMDEGREDPVRARLMALRAEAPAPVHLQVRVWERLTPAQQEAAAASIREAMAELQERNAQERLRRMREQRQERAQDERPARARAPAGVAAVDFGRENLERMLESLELGKIPQDLWDRLPARVVERLEGVPEDRRAAVLARYLRGLLGPDRGASRGGD